MKFSEVIIIKNYKPHRNALNFLRLATSVLALALTVACVILLENYNVAMYIGVGVVCGLAFFVDFILLPLYFAKCSFTIGQNGATKHGGIFFTTASHVKKSSVQYVTVVKTPLSKLTAMNFIIIHVLGGIVILNFVSSDDVDEIDVIMKNWAEGGGK